jgi:hypothetical protein
MIALAALLLAMAAPDAPAAEATAGAPPAAQPPSAQAPVAELKPAPKKAKDDKVCWEEAETGTRFTKRYCADRSQLQDRTRRDQDWKNRIQDQPPADGK